MPRGLLRASGERGAVPLPLSKQVGETIGALGVGEMSVARTRAGRWRMGLFAADGTGETNETTTFGDQQRRDKRGRGEREDEVNTTLDDDAKKNAFFCKGEKIEKRRDGFGHHGFLRARKER